jgi:hypothetical protein
VKKIFLLSKQKVIDDLFVEVRAFSGDPLTKAYLTYYLCVRVSGFIEDCVRTVFSDYVDANSKNSVKTFAIAKLKKFPNPTWSAILALTKDFDENWAKQLKTNVDNSCSDAVDSIVTNRNIIAHGGSSSITLNELEGYYRKAIQVIDELEKICV